MRMTVYREHRLLGQGTGETGFPQSPTRGRVWEGVALAQGTGETGFPQSPTCGRVWEGVALPRIMFIPSVCGASRMDG